MSSATEPKTIMAVPLIVHNILALKDCKPEIVSSLETKKLGLKVQLPTAEYPSQIFIGYERKHVEKLILHKGDDVIRIISEDEAKKRGITVLRH